MDELHDAIQDAQYIGAVTNGQRGPSVAYYTATPIEMAQYLESQEKNLGKDWLNLENILDQPIGFYLFRRHCETEHARAAQKLRFLSEISKFRAFTDDTQRLEKAREIFDEFCVPSAANSPNASDPNADPASDSGSHHPHHHHGAHKSNANGNGEGNAGGNNAGSDKKSARNVAVADCSHIPAPASPTGSIFVVSSNHGLYFWKKGCSSVKLQDMQDLYRANAGDSLAIGVGGELVKRMGCNLKRNRTNRKATGIGIDDRDTTSNSPIRSSMATTTTSEDSKEPTTIPPASSPTASGSFSGSAVPPKRDTTAAATVKESSYRVLPIREADSLECDAHNSNKSILPAIDTSAATVGGGTAGGGLGGTTQGGTYNPLVVSSTNLTLAMGANGATASTSPINNTGGTTTPAGVGGTTTGTSSNSCAVASVPGTVVPSAYSEASYAPMSVVPTTFFDELEACVLWSLEENQMPSFRVGSFYKRLLNFLFLQTRKVCEDDFTVLRVLGRGGFGMVNGCIKRTSASLYAMKVMNKKIIKQKHAEKLCVAERKILAMISSPFVVCLKYAFQTPDELFLVLDLRTGGDLSFHLNRCRFSEHQVRYWSAQVLLGLQHLHEKNIVYRDLKPENILLDEKGNCSISDLGLAVEVTPTLSGRCGTRGYWAPEMLTRDEHGQRTIYNQAVDWWSYGCLVYELLYGKCPFRTSKAKALHEDKQQAYDKATLELTPSYDPKYFSPEAADLIQRLLVRDPKKRLGANGAEEVKKMKFFDSIDWVKMQNLNTTPPFVPDNDINAASQADIGAFDISAIKGMKLSEKDQSYYTDWDFISEETFQKEAIEYLEWEIKNGPCTTSLSGNSCCSLL